MICFLQYKKKDATIDISISSLGIVTFPKKFVTNYDFTKSVEQNLDDPYFRDCVAELLLT